MKFEKITYDNLELACKIQNTIFPEEDARQNFIEQINQDPYRKEQDYSIVYVDNEPIGVTGIYSYHEYPESAWLGWFGILNEYRNKGYGKKALEKTIELAKEKGAQLNIDFGSQIRSYVMHPYSLVKDHRTLYETSNVKEVLDGEIDEFIKKNLKGGENGANN